MDRGGLGDTRRFGQLLLGDSPGTTGDLKHIP